MKFPRILFTILALAVLALVAYNPRPPAIRPGLMAVAATPSGNQLVNCSTLIANTGSGQIFTWAGAAQSCSNGNLIINRATFVSWIKNSGSCASGANSSTYVMTWNDMLGCKSNSVSQHSVTIASGTGSTTYNCTLDQLKGISSCSVSSSNEPYTLASTSSSTVAPTGTATQLGISLTGVSLSDSCGMGITYAVYLYNSGGTNVASWANLSAASWSTTWYGAGAAAGTYTWKIQESSSSQGCGSIGNPTGSYTESVSWTGSNVTSYY